MTRQQNNVSPRVARRLADVAREMRELIYGDEAFPEWGTQFRQIEQQGMEMGLELARLFMEQSVTEQAQQTPPPEAYECDGETATPASPQKSATLETPAGEVHWDQPQARLSQARRDFFPSGPSAGDRR